MKGKICELTNMTRNISGGTGAAFTLFNLSVTDGATDGRNRETKASSRLQLRIKERG